MSTTVEELVEQAMTLPSESRARLADLLVESLDVDALGRIDRLWAAEAKRRRDEVHAGKVETIPGDSRAIEQMCVNEAEARFDAYERGEIDALPEEEAIAWLNEQAAKR